MKNLHLLSILSFFVLVFSANIFALAHVVVRPNSVGIGAYQNFTVSVPTEKDLPTISLRLVIPDTLTAVRPNVKPGWEIDLKKTGEGEDTKIQEIIWKNGSIPADQRDEFVFSAKTPATPQSITWKAYQTYSDGSVVSWDQSADSEAENTGPYSQTKVVDDLNTPTTASNVDQIKNYQKDLDALKSESGNLKTLIYSAFTLAFVSFILAILAYQRSRSNNHI